MEAPVAEITETGAAPHAARALLVLLHGRGQSPAEMREAVLARLPLGGVRAVLPAAPGGSWYAARAVDPLTATTAAALDAAILAVDAAVARAQAGAAPGLPLLVAGFSQGACLALEWALRRGPWTGALAVLAGCRVGGATAPAPGALLGGLPALLANGDRDESVPAAETLRAAETLARAGARVRAEILPGRPHAVSAAETQALAEMLAALRAGRPALPPAGGRP